MHVAIKSNNYDHYAENCFKCYKNLCVFFDSEIQDFPGRIRRQVFDDILDKEVQQGMLCSLV